MCSILIYKLHLFNHLMVLWKTAHFQDFDEGTFIVKYCSSCFKVEMPYSAWSIDVRMTYTVACYVTHRLEDTFTWLWQSLSKGRSHPFESQTGMTLRIKNWLAKHIKFLRAYWLKDVSFENMGGKTMRQVRERDEESNHFWLGLSHYHRVKNWKMSITCFTSITSTVLSGSDFVDSID